MPAVLYTFKLVCEKSEVYFKAVKVDDDSGVGNQVTVGDINKDGKNDILVSNKKNAVFSQKK